MAFHLEPQPMEELEAGINGRALLPMGYAEPKRKLAPMEQFRAFLGVVSRTRLGRLLSFSGKRDYEEIFGWNKMLSIGQILYMYNRGGIAKRVIDAFPDAIWARPPQLWSPGDDVWTANWAKFARDLDLWSVFHRLDKLSRLGQYAILVIGTDKGRLEDPLSKASNITYLQPFGEESVRISSFVTDQNSANFGRPARYRVYPDNAAQVLSGGRSLLVPGNTQSSSTTRVSFEVDASRVIHVARSVLEDDVYGQPMMAPIWDYLTDLRKVVGSSSESYWIMANRGLQADIDKEMSLNADDQAALQTELDDYFHGYRRFIRTKGVTLKELQNDVADPEQAFKVLVTLISGSTAIPQRILLGSEAGQLASTQDKGNWAERVEEDRSLFSEPRIIKPFLEFVLATGIMPAPSASTDPAVKGTGIEINWPDAYRMSPLERGQTSAQTARTIANITKMLESKSQRAANLLNDSELRALVGVSTDNRILSDNPDP